MTPFLTYELLSPEDADPVIIRITGQRSIGFEDFTASNGVTITTFLFPTYNVSYKYLFTHGSHRGEHNRRIPIPLADWPLVKAAIEELNEAKKEKNMSDKHCFEYNKLVRDMVALAEPVGYDVLVNPDATLTVTRKKPKVKVEYGLVHDLLVGGKRYYVVQFRVTGFEWKTGVPLDGRSDYYAVIFVGGCPSSINFSHYPKGFFNLLIGLDARDKWSAPVLLPESVYSRLDEICRALEEKANVR